MAAASLPGAWPAAAKLTVSHEVVRRAFHSAANVFRQLLQDFARFNSPGFAAVDLTAVSDDDIVAGLQKDRASDDKSDGSTYDSASRAQREWLQPNPLPRAPGVIWPCVWCTGSHGISGVRCVPECIAVTKVAIEALARCSTGPCGHMPPRPDDADGGAETASGAGAPPELVTARVRITPEPLLLACHVPQGAELRGPLESLQRSELRRRYLYSAPLALWRPFRPLFGLLALASKASATANGGGSAHGSSSGAGGAAAGAGGPPADLESLRALAAEHAQQSASSVAVLVCLRGQYSVDVVDLGTEWPHVYAEHAFPMRAAKGGAPTAPKAVAAAWTADPSKAVLGLSPQLVRELDACPLLKAGAAANATSLQALGAVPLESSGGAIDRLVTVEKGGEPGRDTARFLLPQRLTLQEGEAVVLQAGRFLLRLTEQACRTALAQLHTAEVTWSSSGGQLIPAPEAPAPQGGWPTPDHVWPAGHPSSFLPLPPTRAQCFAERNSAGWDGVCPSSASRVGWESGLHIIGVAEAGLVAYSKVPPWRLTASQQQLLNGSFTLNYGAAAAQPKPARAASAGAAGVPPAAASAGGAGAASAAAAEPQPAAVPLGSAPALSSGSATGMPAGHAAASLHASAAGSALAALAAAAAAPAAPDTGRAAPLAAAAAAPLAAAAAAPLAAAATLSSSQLELVSADAFAAAEPGAAAGGVGVKRRAPSPLEKEAATQPAPEGPLVRQQKEGQGEGAGQPRPAKRMRREGLAAGGSSGSDTSSSEAASQLRGDSGSSRTSAVAAEPPPSSADARQRAEGGAAAHLAHAGVPATAAATAAAPATSAAAAASGSGAPQAAATRCVVLVAPQADHSCGMQGTRADPTRLALRQAAEVRLTRLPHRPPFCLACCSTCSHVPGAALRCSGRQASRRLPAGPLFHRVMMSLPVFTPLPPPLPPSPAGPAPRRCPRPAANRLPALCACGAGHVWVQRG